MQKLTRYIPLCIVVLAFARSLIIDRTAGNQPITPADFAFLLPLFAYFWPLLTVFDMAQDSYTYLSREDKRSYSLLVVGLTAILFFMWVLLLLNASIAPFVALSTTAAFAFGLYDLLRLINNLQKVGELNRIVWLQFGVPFAAAAGMYALVIIGTRWAQVPNPVAIFFILRACMAALPQPAIAPRS